MKKLLLALLLASGVAHGHSYRYEKFDAPAGSRTDLATEAAHHIQPNSKNMVVFIPGGNGTFNIAKEPPTEFRGFVSVFKSISDLSGADVISINSPYPLLDNAGSWYPAMRDTNDHLDRIEAVVRHYKKTHQIWLMGHSNGSFSVTAFMRRLEKQKETNLVKGIILSGARDVAQFDRSPEVPVLFVHHVKDGCRATQFAEAQRNFARVQKINSQSTRFVSVDSTVTTFGNPCESGYHMMQGAYNETAQAIANFVKDTQ
jgi:hypothetical protein